MASAMFNFVFDKSERATQPWYCGGPDVQRMESFGLKGSVSARFRRHIAIQGAEYRITHEDPTVL